MSRKYTTQLQEGRRDRFNSILHQFSDYYFENFKTLIHWVIENLYIKKNNEFLPVKKMDIARGMNVHHWEVSKWLKK